MPHGSPRVADLLAALPGAALICGDPDARARTVLLAADARAAVLDEATAAGSGVLLTHRPPGPPEAPALPATTPKGRLIHRAISAGVALCAWPDAADRRAADSDVSRALADALGLAASHVPATDPAPWELIATAVPADAADQVVDAMAAAGAGAIGDYTRCAWTTPGTGLFTPGWAAGPTIGSAGAAESVVEVRVEMLLPHVRRAAVLAALRSAHPYEEPALHIAEVLGPASGVVGELPEPATLARFAVDIAERLDTPVRSWGSLDHSIRTVALGAAPQSRPTADAWLGLDIAGSEATDLLEAGWPAVLDVARGPALRPWLDATARRIEAEGFAARVSQRAGDTWTVARKP